MKGGDRDASTKPNNKQIAERTVRACIASNTDLYAVSNEALAIKLGVTLRTMQNKRDKPGTFTLNELWVLSKPLKLTPIQAASIVLGRPLTKKEIKDFILL